MVDARKQVTLRGLHVSIADIGDQMHLCHPVLSFENDDALYLAHRLDWRDDPDVLAATDPDEASHGTLLPRACRLPIASGQGVVAAGDAFVQAAEDAGLQLEPEIAFARVIQDQPCWIGLATPAVYTALRTRLTEGARDAFDRALGDAVRNETRLSDSGNAALLLLRRCGQTRRDDLAIRQLAGARQNREFDLYRRLLIRFALELNTQERVLDERAIRHVALVAQCRAMGIPSPREEAQRMLTEHIRPGYSEDGADKRRLIPKALDLATWDVLMAFIEVNRALLDRVKRDRVRTRAAERTSTASIGLRYDTGKGARPIEILSVLLPTKPTWKGRIEAYIRGHERAPIDACDYVKNTGETVAGKPVYRVIGEPSRELIRQLLSAFDNSSLSTR